MASEARRNGLKRRKPLRRKAWLNSGLFAKPNAAGTDATTETMRGKAPTLSPKLVRGLNRDDRKEMRIELDRLSALLCKLAAHCECQRCGKSGARTAAGYKTMRGMQWHHVYSRSIIALRWREENWLCVCAGCHLWWHHNPLEAAEWFADTFPTRSRKLRILRGARVYTQNVVALRIYLRAEVERATEIARRDCAV